MKYFYIQVLKNKAKIEWLGENKYRLTQYYENGNKRWEEEYKDGRQHGKSTGWYKNGKKCWETEYEDGKEHGEDISWYKNGNKFWKSYYWGGKLVSEQEYLTHLKTVTESGRG